jgi:two-component system sensor histidine kinase CreC
VVRLSLVQRGRWAEVQVLDEGPGIPAFANDRVFEKFYSLPRPGTGRRSTGLGLAFVREVADQHRGRARVHNAASGGDGLARGAMASLSLPLLARPAASA